MVSTWYFLVFPWYVPCETLPVVETARNWKSLEKLSTNHEPIGFLFFLLMEKLKTYKIWTKHGHFTLFCMVLHEFTTANTFCAKGSPHLLVLYCKFCCRTVICLPPFCVDTTNIPKKKDPQRCHIWRIFDEGLWFFPHFDYGSSFVPKDYMAYTWGLVTTNWDGRNPVAGKVSAQKVIMWQTSQHAWEKGPWLFGV